ncbi:MAG TPA: DUF6659 family protein [Nitrososphaerales archaeon]|jgi:hypothetical protein|nr:DUF6659 family protein [Nitrososphaerales archaeon]
MLQIQWDKICTEIFKFDRRVRSAIILDQSGRQIAGGMKKGIPSLEPQSQDIRLIAGITIQINNDLTWDNYFGKLQFSFQKRERISIMTFYLGDKLVLVSMEPDFTLQQAQDLRNQLVTNHAQEFR